MTKKTFTVIKTLKVDGVELVAGDDVSLEPGQAQALLGTFVEEKATPTTVIPANPDTPRTITPANFGTVGEDKGTHKDGTYAEERGGKLHNPVIGSKGSKGTDGL